MQQRQANSLVKLGLALGAAGQPDSAEEAFTASVAIRRARGDRHGEAIALHNLADMQLTHDRLAPAVANLELAVPIRQEVGDPIGTLLSLVNLGKAYCLLGNMDRALSTLTDALTANIQLQDRPQQWQILIALADVALRQDLPDAALARANEALEISRALDHRYGEILALRQLSRAYARLGESGRSLAVLEQARELPLVSWSRDH
jgi:tetratricopeptide (TPR) repeat protein